jgi:hypothetical protein
VNEIYAADIPKATAVSAVDVAVAVAASATVPTERVPTTMPAAIPTDQAYYWSVPWQRDIRESLDALAAGEYEDFDDPNDPNDVARWLLADEND